MTHIGSLPPSPSGYAPVSPAAAETSPRTSSPEAGYADAGSASGGLHYARHASGTIHPTIRKALARTLLPVSVKVVSPDGSEESGGFTLEFSMPLPAAVRDRMAAMIGTIVLNQNAEEEHGLFFRKGDCAHDGFTLQRSMQEEGKTCDLKMEVDKNRVVIRCELTERTAHGKEVLFGYGYSPRENDRLTEATLAALARLDDEAGASAKHPRSDSSSKEGQGRASLKRVRQESADATSSENDSLAQAMLAEFARIDEEEADASAARPVSVSSESENDSLAQAMLAEFARIDEEEADASAARPVSVNSERENEGEAPQSLRSAAIHAPPAAIPQGADAAPGSTPSGIPAVDEPMYLAEADFKKNMTLAALLQHRGWTPVEVSELKFLPRHVEILRKAHLDDKTLVDALDDWLKVRQELGNILGNRLFITMPHGGNKGQQIPVDRLSVPSHFRTYAWYAASGLMGQDKPQDIDLQPYSEELQRLPTLEGWEKACAPIARYLLEEKKYAEEQLRTLTWRDGDHLVPETLLSHWKALKQKATILLEGPARSKTVFSRLPAQGLLTDYLRSLCDAYPAGGAGGLASASTQPQQASASAPQKFTPNVRKRITAFVNELPTWERKKAKTAIEGKLSSMGNAEQTQALTALGTLLGGKDISKKLALIENWNPLSVSGMTEAKTTLTAEERQMLDDLAELRKHPDARRAEDNIRNMLEDASEKKRAFRSDLEYGYYKGKVWRLIYRDRRGPVAAIMALDKDIAARPRDMDAYTALKEWQPETEGD